MERKRTIDMKRLSRRQVKDKVLNVAGGNEDERLGYVVIFTVGSVEVPHAEIKEWWKGQDVLAPEQMPRKPTAIDAFRNMCSMENVNIWEKVDVDLIEENAEYFKEKGVKVRTEYLTTANPNNRDEYVVTRRVWIQPVGNEDAKMVVPEYPNVVRLRYNNQKDEIDTIPFESYIGSDVVVDIDRVANQDFQRQKLLVNGTRHRNLIRNVIEECGGIHLLGQGGVYFLPAPGYEKLEMLSKYFDEVVSQPEYATTGHRCDIMTMDAFDDDKMRQRIQEDVEDQIRSQYDALLDDTLEYLEKNAAKESDKEQAIIQRSLDARLKNAEKIGALKGQYEKLLGVRIGIEQAVANAPKDLTGRAAAMLVQMQRAALGEVE